VSLILLLSVAAGFRPSRFLNGDTNRLQSTVPAVTENQQAPTPTPQLKTEQPADPTPVNQGEAPAPVTPGEITKPIAASEITKPKIETKPSLPSGAKPAKKTAVETQKRLATNGKAAPQKAVISDRESYEFNRDRRMMFDDYGRYRRYRYNPYWHEYRDRFHYRRRPRWYDR
jgi:cytoskeletal protein RodZ